MNRERWIFGCRYVIAGVCVACTQRKVRGIESSVSGFVYFCVVVVKRFDYLSNYYLLHNLGQQDTYSIESLLNSAARHCQVAKN